MPEQARREEHGVATTQVVWIALGFLVAVGISVLALLAYFHATVRGGLATSPRVFPGPELQADPRGNLRQLQLQQNAQLQGYAWTDRERGIARIPIEDAMALVAARGAQAYDPLDQAPKATGGTAP
jgi:hypothetical protein